MNSAGWKSCRLGDLIRIEHGYAFKGTQFGAAGAFAVNLGNFSPRGGLIFPPDNRTKRIPGAYPPRFLLAAGDLVIALSDVTQTGSILGKPGFVPHDDNVYVQNQRVGRVRVLDKNKIAPDFLFYLFTSRTFSASVQSSANSTTILNTSPDRIYEFQFSLPPLSDQSAIAAVLKNLDDKIDLNRRMNETLEAIARAIFKSWFQDFDPVRAKASQGASFRLSAEIANLFPDTYHRSIPSNWRQQTLADITDLNARQLKIDDEDQLIKYVDIASARRGEVLETQILRAGDAPTRARRLVRDGDTVISTVRPGNRAYFFVVDPEPNLVVSTGYAVLTPNPNCSALVYLTATSNDAIDHLVQVADGGAYPAVRPDQVGELEIISPSEEVAAAFERLALPLLRRIALNQRESVTLGTIRDSLLPKLISGEMQLREAEAAVAK